VSILGEISPFVQKYRLVLLYPNKFILSKLVKAVCGQNQGKTAQKGQLKRSNLTKSNPFTVKSRFF
jgi:hypothetical protein